MRQAATAASRLITVIATHLRIGFAGDVLWEFDIPKASYRGAERLVAALQA